MTRDMAHWVDITAIDPAFATAAGGALVGIGLMCLFRHKASLGGVGILAEYLQERHGVRSGTVQLVCDIRILIVGASILPRQNVALLILSALVMHDLLIVHHRSDRYVGVS